MKESIKKAGLQTLKGIGVMTYIGSGVMLTFYGIAGVAKGINAYLKVFRDSD